MEQQKYIWLYQNINKYQFFGESANQIKMEICRLVGTGEYNRSDAMLGYLKELYDKFLTLFYNNPLGYKNGLNQSYITTDELDCYFLVTANETFPIGYYKALHPTEAPQMVEWYLGQCKQSVETDKNNLIMNWKNQIDTVYYQYENVKKEKAPSLMKAVLGGVSALLLLVLAIITFVRLDFFNVLANGGDFDEGTIPLGQSLGMSAWVGYLMFGAILLTLSIILWVLLMKEIKLLGEEKEAKSLLANAWNYLTGIDQALVQDLNENSFALFEAARQGKNMKIGISSNASSIKYVEQKIKGASEFTQKTKPQRSGVRISLIILAAVLAVLFLLSVTVLVEEPEDGYIEGTLTGENVTEAPSFATEYPTERPVLKSYEAYKEDVTWYEANRRAQEMGGYLVCINSYDEFQTVCAKAEEMDINVFWVGAIRSEYDDWEDTSWLSGEDITYTNWLPGEPTYYSEEGDPEEFLMVFKVKDVWYFNDATYDVEEYYAGKIGYIVEVEE